MSQRPDSPRDFWVGFVIGLLLSIVVAVAFVWTGEAHAQVSERIFRDGFGGSSEGGPVDEPADSCEHPLVEPFGWTPQQRSWVDTWSSPRPRGPRAVFPNSVGTPVPIGANKGQYLAVPFVMDANLTITVTWDIAQPQPGYLVRPADSMFIGFSACRGDFRLRAGCSKVAGGGSLFLSSRQTGENICPLQAGVEYWMTVAPVTPGDGLDFGEHTCSNTAANSANGCDVQARHTGN